MAASLGRIAVMSFVNHIVTPHWLLWAGWLKDLEKAYAIITMYLLYIAVFNLTLALIVASVSITAYVILRRSGYLNEGERTPYSR
ncbi:MAG: hypothetical protein QXQ03_01835 [Candidatus Nezhaarchaeales archaeon]